MALVLTRKVDESIVFMVGSEMVRVIVTDIHYNRVSLTLKADKPVVIVREELMQKKVQER